MNTGARLALKEISRGEKSLSGGDFEAAVSSFVKALQITPADGKAQAGLARAYAGLASAYIADGDAVSADQVLKEAFPDAGFSSPLDYMEEDQKEALYSYYGLKVTDDVLEGYNGEERELVLPPYLGITEIGEGAFADNETLESVVIPESVTAIGDSAFISCTGLASVTIPESVTGIGEGAFTGCESLASVTIPESVTSIGDYAFLGCTGLTSVTMPNSLTEMGNCVFAETAVEAPVLANNGTILCYIPTDCEDYTVPDTVKSINGAFYHCGALTSVTIPEGVTNIGYYSFAYCGRLKSVELPESVTTIGEGAFRNCDRLKSITIPAGVTFIGEKAFANSDRLTIYAEEGSYAAGYAEENGISLNEESTGEQKGSSIGKQ